MVTLARRSTGIGALLVFFLAAVWLFSPSTAQQPGPVVNALYDEPPPANPTGAGGDPQRVDSVLLLRNGEMMRGQIVHEGDRYDVFVPGGEIHVKAADVQYHCRDAQEAYLRKRALIRGDNALDHLELAQWCLKAGLVPSAAEELAEAAALEPSHPLIPVLERRVKLASLPAPQAAANAKPAALGPTPQELDRMVRGMPPKTVELFAQTIQPMLVNHCAAAGCHGQGVQNGFRLFRTPSGSPPSRLLTQRNLHATLQWLDRSNPDASPLLNYPTRPHGTATIPVFSDKQVTQFKQLREWCYRVGQAEGPVMQASYLEEAAPQERAAPLTARSAAKGYRRPSRDAGGDSAGKETSGRTSGFHPWESATIDLKERSGRTGPKRGAEGGGTAAKPGQADPFDPEVFNRQFSSAGRPARVPEAADRDNPPPPRSAGTQDPESR